MFESAPSVLACPVKGCGKPLACESRRWVCPEGHGFDRARSGYTNLLQPGDRRSLAAGDRPEATRARARLLDRGVGEGHLAVLAERAVRAARAAPRRPARVLEVGCGVGALLDRIARELAEEGWCAGLDLSATAADRAAKLGGPGLFLVANADRRLPFLDGAVDVLVSVAGPKAPAEFARVLAPGGVLLLAVPGPGDLAELREAVQGDGRELPRGDRAAAAFAGPMELVGRRRLVERHALDREALGDLLLASYRGGRRAEAERAQALGELEVTLELELLEFRRA
ncbi:MAG: methyltransferase domain-containing protein [Planctomycetaceae bacterium]|nr:methyltransferase domain-containing protein [Planctomycetaceae bacterium]